MVATNASLRVASTERAAALKSANGTDTASKRVLSERSVMRGLSGVVAGLTTRAIEPVVLVSCPIVPRGSRNSSPAVRNEARPTLAPVFASIAMRWVSERAPGTDQRGDTTRCVSGTDAWSNTGASFGSASRSTMWASS